MKKKIVAFVVVASFIFSGLSASAMSFNYFFGGVTGVPNNGTTWGEYLPRGKRVFVTASGQYSRTAYANSGGDAYASVARAWSGNKSWWGLW